MMKPVVLGIGLVAIVASGPAAADERPEHYQAEPAETLQQAIANLNEYNARLASILAGDELGAAEMNEVHQLTYTLETALARLDAELAVAADSLETVHQASESRDAAAIRQEGRRYLATLAEILGQP
jgi:hypothetical protein